MNDQDLSPSPKELKSITEKQVANTHTNFNVDETISALNPASVFDIENYHSIEKDNPLKKELGPDLLRTAMDANETGNMARSNTQTVGIQFQSNLSQIKETDEAMQEIRSINII